MLEGFLGKLQFPVVGSLDALAAVFLCLLPVVEVTNEIDFSSVRSPLTEHPALGELMQSEVEVTGSKVGECLLSVVGELTDLPQCMVMTTTDGILKGFQP